MFCRAGELLQQSSSKLAIFASSHAILCTYACFAALSSLAVGFLATVGVFAAEGGSPQLERMRSLTSGMLLPAEGGAPPRFADRAPILLPAAVSIMPQIAQSMTLSSGLHSGHGVSTLGALSNECLAATPAARAEKLLCWM